MSSRIRADADGPGENAHRTPAEPADERSDVSATPVAEESPEPSQRPSDAPAEASGVEPSTDQREEDERDKFRKRIDSLTFQGHQARRELAEARAQLAEIQRQQRQQQPQGPEAQAEERAYQRMQQERLEADFNRDCNTLWERGVGEYGEEMNEAKRGLDAVGWGNRPDALAALTALPDGHRIYRELASDLDNAARILSLPPMRMAVELARMSRGESSLTPNVSRETNREPPRDLGEERRSRAPEPLRPVGGNSARADRPLDQVSMAEFIRRRDREERGSRIRR